MILALAVFAYGAVVSEVGQREIDGRGALEIWVVPISVFPVVAIIMRRQILANLTTRRLAAFLGIVILTPFLITLIGVQSGVSMIQRSMFSWVAMAGVASLGELVILPGLWPCVVVYFVGISALLFAPDLAVATQAFVLVSTAAFFVRALLLHAKKSRAGPDD